ncbi:DNA repair exonuclease [Martelella alba]|uniref:DNA repair exonuclease n=1 Tax=Martelella alba TaxID=2590451 RepID=A0A506UI78_9HYPH|nr:DNA repair exonuclease [Martelella alba]TPW33016.1 DNA repair exonuclease [Martelella alba]
MARFRFIHAADLHLGSPLSGLALKDEALARRFAEASRDAFTGLIDAALAEKVDFLLIAGDIYDGAWKDNRIGLFFNREIARLDRADIPVFILRGNHDAESVVTRTITMPENVREFSVKAPETMRIDTLKVAIHGQGFATRSVNDNLAASYPPAMPGWFNIGMLHTSLSGRPPHAPYAPCTVDDLLARGYDYWALGHVHAYEQVVDMPPVIYPGNIQGRSIRETGEKGVVLVTVDEGEVRHRRLILDRARFERATVNVTPQMGEDDIFAAIEARAANYAETAGERPVALRLVLSGTYQQAGRMIAERQQWHDEAEAALQRSHGDLWLEKLEFDLETPEVARPVIADAEAAVDFRALIEAVAGSPEFAAQAGALADEIRARLPASVSDETVFPGGDLARLLAEAERLLFARLDMAEES